MSQLTEDTLSPSRTVTSLSLFFSLTSGQWRPGKFWHQRSFRRKFMLRSLLMPRLSREWMNELAQWPELNVLLTRQPRLPVRLHRPYLAANLGRKTLLEALRFHYAQLYSFMSHEELKTYMNTSGLRLAQLEGKNGEYFSLELTMMISLDKEGDSTILIRNEAGETLAEITFTLCEYQGKRTLFIGGLQGGKRELPHEAIQSATKACHGLFPKRLVMEAICCFAQRLQTEQIIAVSNETHIYRSLRYRDKSDKIHANYDEFWAAVGGERHADGYYHIPCAITRKDTSEVASKKRAEYRRRYQMLDAIHEQMSDMFSH
ncbi:VirK/YbjX family protein [Citrobacter amalonaticus]|nr:VirK/YbjX family protein [Citrobacter amalonaticus]